MCQAGADFNHWVNRELANFDSSVGLSTTITAIANNPLPTIATIGLTLIGVPPPLASAMVTAAQGGSLEDIAISAGKAYISGKVGDYAGKSFAGSEYAKNLTPATAAAITQIVTSASGAAAGTALSGGSFQDVLKSGFTSAVGTYVSTSLMKEMGYTDPNKLDAKVVQGAISSATGAILAGKDIGKAITGSVTSTLLRVGIEAGVNTLVKNSETLTGLQTSINAKKKDFDAYVNNIFTPEKAKVDAAYTTAKTTHGTLSSKIQTHNTNYEHYASIQRTSQGSIDVIEMYERILPLTGAEVKTAAEAFTTANTAYTNASSSFATVSNDYNTRITALNNLYDQANTLVDANTKLAGDIGTKTGEYQTAAAEETERLTAAAKVEADKFIADAKAAADKAAEAAKEAARIEAERVEAERVEAERVEAERVEAERVEAERVEAEKVEAERVEAARVEAERVEAERVEAEKVTADLASTDPTEAAEIFKSVYGRDPTDGELADFTGQSEADARKLLEERYALDIEEPPVDEPEGCAEGFHEDPVTGLCVPDYEEEEEEYQECPLGQVRNLITGECEVVEEEEPEGCAEGFHEDPVTGLCVPDEEEEEEDTTCPDGYVYNVVTQECEPVEEEEGCAEGFHEDPVTGLCVPDDDEEEEECPEGQVRNLNTGLCEIGGTRPITLPRVPKPTTPKPTTPKPTTPKPTIPPVTKPPVTTPPVTTPPVTEPSFNWSSLLGLLSANQEQAPIKPELVGKAGWEDEEGPIDYTPFDYRDAIAEEKAKTDAEKARMVQEAGAARGGSVNDILAQLTGFYDEDDSQSTGDPYLDELLATIR